MWLYASSISTGSNIEMPSILPWHTSQRSIHLQLWTVASNRCILDFRASHVRIPIIGRRAWATPLKSSDLFSHACSEVPRGGLWHLDSQWTRFDDQVSAQSIQQAFSAIWRSISGLSKYHEIRTFSIIYAKPGFMADTVLILALPCFRSCCLFPMSTLSFSPKCGSHSWASQHLVRPFALRQLMNAPKAGCMTCAMHDRWFPNAGHTIPEASSVDCSSWIIECFEEALSIVTPRNRPSVSSTRSSMSFKCTASLAPSCWPLTYHHYLAFETWNKQAINLIERELNFMQCPIPIHIVKNIRSYG